MIRYLSGLTLRLCRAAQGRRTRWHTVVAENHAHTTATIEFGDGYPAMAPTPGNLALQEALSSINVALGRNPMPAFDRSRRHAFLDSTCDQAGGHSNLPFKRAAWHR